MINVDLTDILIPCPDRDFALRKASICFECKFYNGITRATERGKPIPGNQTNFYQIICARPISRKLIQVLQE